MNVNSDNRRTVTLFNSSKDRSSVQYARYLLAVQLGRFLTEDEEADHIDDDKTNDSIENLRVLSCKEHRLKSTVFLKGVCYICGKEILKKKSELRPSYKHDLLAKGLLTCSRKCGYVKSSITVTIKLSKAK